jgi:putative flippase GtrA
MILTNPRERTRFLRFLVVGVFGATVDFGIFNLLAHGFDIQVVPAGTISFLCAVASNFLWNRYWTYPDSRSKTVARQFVEFTVINAMGLLIRVPILAFLAPLLRRLFEFLAIEIGAMTPETLGNNLTLAIAVGIVMFWNFFANRYWTYADVE